MEYQLTNNLNIGATFSEATIIFKKNGNKNIFENLITLNAIEENENLSPNEKEILIQILNSNIDPFEKRIRIMRSLDKNKDFSSNIALILKENLPKMEMVKKILHVFRDHYIKSDVLKKEFGEVLTPPKIMKEMIDNIDPKFWKSPYNENGSIKKILETSNGSGIFLWGVISKFMIGLKDYFPDQNERYKFIVENMIYACELQKSKMFHWLCIADLYDEYDLNVYCESFLGEGFSKHMEEVWKVDKFSLCLSNPPYQVMDGGHGSSAKPLYNLFTERAISISDKVLFITPSRWFAGGKGLDSYRKYMIESRKLKIIKHESDATKIFGKSVEIKGGVSYFIWDNEYDGNCKFNGLDVDLSKMDVIITDPKSIPLINKITSSSRLFLNSICRGRGDNVFGIQSNDTRLTDFKKEGYILCHVSIKKGRYKYIDPNIIKNKTKLTTYKVITTEAATKGGEGFGNIYAINPNETLNGSYVYFETGSFSESTSLLSYLKTKFANKMLSLRKVSQHVKPDTCKWIPMVPFDREWTDEKLFEYFDLSEEEIDLIIGKDRIKIINEDNLDYTDSYWYEILDNEKIRIIIPMDHDVNCICRNILNDFHNENESKWIIKIGNDYNYISNISTRSGFDGNGSLSRSLITLDQRDMKYGMDKIYFDFLLSRCNSVVIGKLIRDQKLETILK